ncbi:hypothetical protein GDO81_014013 [Engystomops pustulosus]|uniref:Uncharacterized protein n=1 Tax=Engystomops pustulosus TaxID=76066 RepID=A0AAV7B7E2_ENGPU|nr:hypothetical protein GDO81_014013 [Engystomops pustulosus]KAG8568470.1 hypothetical protein GDO81_014013 [Engystomops pustulosus]KAG8568471.1 hypothetical protein GDO81_014013 [Engystomops pustulosus]
MTLQRKLTSHLETKACPSLVGNLTGVSNTVGLKDKRIHEEEIALEYAHLSICCCFFFIKVFSY